MKLGGIRKRGLEGMWKMSVYKGYWGMNGFYRGIEGVGDGGFRGKGFGILGIIGWFCYRVKF